MRKSTASQDFYSPALASWDSTPTTYGWHPHVEGAQLAAARTHDERRGQEAYVRGIHICLCQSQKRLRKRDKNHEVAKTQNAYLLQKHMPLHRCGAPRMFVCICASSGWPPESWPRLHLVQISGTSSQQDVPCILMRRTIPSQLRGRNQTNSSNIVETILKHIVKSARGMRGAL